MQSTESLKIKLLALRSAIDEALGELDAATHTAAESPRSRRNRKGERVARHAANYSTGRIRKPRNRITIKNATSAN